MLRLTIKLSQINFPKGSLYGPVRVVTHSRFLASQQKSPQCPSPVPPVVPPPKKSSFKTKFYLGLTGIVLAVGGVIYYAKQDVDFRYKLDEYIPGTHFFIKRVTAEDKSYIDQTMEALEHVKNYLWTSLFESSPSHPPPKKKSPKEEEYQPPTPAFGSLASKMDDPSKKFTEIRIQSEADVTPVTISGKPQKAVWPVSHPKSIADVEKQMGDAAKDAINSMAAASEAYCAYIKTVFDYVDTSVESMDPHLYDEVKYISGVKKRTAEAAEKAADSATSLMKKLEEVLSLLEDVDEVALKTAWSNIDVLKKDVSEAKKALERHRARACITEEYWMKVMEARKFFTKELKTIFPDIDLQTKRMKVNEQDLDLFVIHAYQQILLLQNQLLKVEQCTTERLNRAIQKTGDDRIQELIDTKVELALEAERLELHEDYQKRLLEMKTVSERDLRQLILAQDKAHQKQMRNAIANKEHEIQQKLNHDFEERLSAEKNKYKAELAALVGRLKGMDDAIKAKAAAEREAQHAQSLWSACQALYRQIRTAKPGQSLEKQIHPLANQITLVSNSAAEGDELVDVVLKAIPKEAVNRGVYPEPALRERFLKVETQARKLAYVPETGGSLYIWILSYLGCWLMNMAADPIPASEINDEPINISQLDTFDILKRARYWMDRGDLDRTLRYMNLLRGASRIIACDWMKEARIFLETAQATDALLAHASASSLRYL